MIMAPRIAPKSSKPPDRKPLTKDKVNGLRWMLSINAALWGLILTGYWIFA